MHITNPERLEELRAQIDVIDRELVAAIARRSDVVREVMTLKNDADAARSTQRVEQVIANVRQLARGSGAPEEVVDATYRAMIAALTQMQLSHILSRAKD